jgi:hypothetical protein
VRSASLDLPSTGIHTEGCATTEFHIEGTKASWADLTDAEFKSNESFADLANVFKGRSDDLQGGDSETTSTGTPHASGECSSNSGNEASDIEQESVCKPKFSSGTVKRQNARNANQCNVPMGFGPVICHVVPVMPYMAVPADVMYDMSDMGEWAPYAYQALCDTGGALGWWPVHLQSFPATADGGDAAEAPDSAPQSQAAGSEPHAGGMCPPSVLSASSEDSRSGSLDKAHHAEAPSTPLQVALAQARAAYYTHQRALNQVRYSPAW